VDPTIEILFNLGFPLLLLVAAYFVGSAIEARHFRNIRKREGELRGLPAITFRTVPAGWEVLESCLVTGSVVISVDYFKRFLAALRHLVGGRVKSYETILDRARREALLRLKEEAAAKGFSAIVNVRIETSRMANGRRGGEGIAGLEILAFGTGLRLRSAPG
jgi:uncharacterized protein YbjQ (UPF0145 family)